MLRVLGQFWRLLKLCVTGKGGKFGLVLYVAVLALQLAAIPVTLQMIQWSKNFYDALQQLDGAEALRQVGIFFGLIGISTTLTILGTYAAKRLEIRWRTALTSAALDAWTTNRAYLDLERRRGQGQDTVLDNPDQRIAEDCRFFLAGGAAGHGSEMGIIPLSLDLITKVVAIFSYMAVLWELSSYALSLSAVGLPFDIPRYMVWASILFVAVSSGLTHWLGSPLKRLYSEQQHREADFRFSLVRVRDNAEAIALSGGERAERREIDGRFDGIVQNFKRVLNQDLKLLTFTYPYNHFVLRLPTIIALPGFFAGALTFGGLMQIASAFSQVAITLSWFIFSYRRLADLVAASSRLDGFFAAVEGRGVERAVEETEVAEGALTLHDLSVTTPAGRALLEVSGLTLSPGENVWLSGASGLGKTSLIRTIAGIWPHAAGRISRASGAVVYLPQQSYFPPGPILDIVAYPRSPEEIPLEERRAALMAVGLGACLDFKAGDGLSGGEAQRLALARVLLLKPGWAFLDEATSALDTAAEAELLALLKREIPGLSLVIVAHREPAGITPLRTVDIDAFAPRAAQPVPA